MEKRNKKRTIMYIVILIIAILALLTSCSCASKYWGLIGNPFGNKQNINIDNNTNDKEVIKNQDLKFDTDDVEISLSDKDTKISFSIKNINPEEVTCKTTDADIATCYVRNDYVVVIPKKEGRVTVIALAEANGKKYQATSTVTINKVNKEIVLSQKSGTLNLTQNNEVSISYKLSGFSGSLVVKSSDTNIAVATAKNGILTIKAKNTGNVTITLTAKDNAGKEYSTSYNLNIINKDMSTPEVKKDSNSNLANLTISNGLLNYNKGTKEYSLNVTNLTDKITLNATKESNKATITYIYNNKTYTSFQNMPISVGTNIVTILVTAEDGTTISYKVVINREDAPTKDNDSSLSNIKISNGTLNFNKNTKEYNIEVDENTNKITLDVNKSSDKAKVSFVFNGKTYSSFEDVVIDDGENVVTIIVTAEDGTSTNYTVVINKKEKSSELDSDNSLLDLNVSNGILDFNKDTKEYSMTVANSVNKITLNANKSSSKATIIYRYNGKTYSNFSNIPINVGNNIVNVDVIAENGNVNTYTININRLEALSSDNTLANIFINNNSIGYNTGTNNYTVEVDSATAEISAIPKSSKATVTYILNNTNYTGNIPLDFGDNLVTINVVAEDGSTNTYNITIHRAKYELSILNGPYICLLEDDACLVNYQILKDNVAIYDNVIVTSSNSDFQVEQKENNWLKVKSNVVGTTNIVITYKGLTASTSLEFKTNEHYITTYADKYTLNYNSSANARNIILNTNIFSGNVIANNSTSKELIICSENDNSICLTISDSSADSGVVESIEFDGKNSDNTSLPIKITALKSGVAKLRVRSNAYGKNTDFEVEIDVVNNYIVKITAGSGIFNAFTDNYEYIIGEGGSVLLTSLPEPYLIDSNNQCLKYRFIGYKNISDTTDTKIYKTEEIKYEELSGNLTLEAVYDMENTEVITTEAKELWVSDIELFHNEEYYQRYNKDKVIYPGANGKYTLEFTNDTNNNNITLKSIKLKEETICISGSGCLNMGYIIKDKAGNYLFGGYDSLNDVENYQVLNDGINTNTEKVINFDGISLSPNSETEITIHWKWVELDDKLDTLIGKNANNDLYKLTIGIGFDTDKVSCGN